MTLDRGSSLRVDVGLSQQVSRHPGLFVYFRFPSDSLCKSVADFTNILHKELRQRLRESVGGNAQGSAPVFKGRASRGRYHLNLRLPVERHAVSSRSSPNSWTRGPSNKRAMGTENTRNRAFVQDSVKKAAVPRDSRQSRAAASMQSVVLYLATRSPAGIFRDHRSELSRYERYPTAG